MRVRTVRKSVMLAILFSFLAVEQAAFAQFAGQVARDQLLTDSDETQAESAAADSVSGAGGHGDCCPAASWCDPLWRVTAEGLFLHRSDPAPAVLIVNTANPTEYLNAADLDLGFHTGVDVSLSRRLGLHNAVGIRYFGVDQWSAQTTTPTTPGDLLRLNTAVPLFMSAGSAIDASYASELHNFEINGLHGFNNRFALIAGFRYLELDEHLRATLVNPATPFTYDVSTRNRLYGFQLGAKARLWESCCWEDDCCCDCGRLAIDADGLAGIFGNSAARGSAIATDRPVGLSSSSGSSTAFVGEIGVTATYRLRNCLSLRAGYHLLWLDGVTLASEQTSSTAFLPPALAPRARIDTQGDVFYHGASVGLEYLW